MKTLNEEILMEMEKRAEKMRKYEQPKSKTQQEKLRLLDEERIMNEGMIRGKKDELLSMESRVGLVNRMGIREELEL
jgi:hypothetical protein